MKGAPEFRDAFNLMLCLYSLGDKVRMKDCFTSMLSIEIPGFTEEEEEEMNKSDNNYTVNYYVYQIGYLKGRYKGKKEISYQDYCGLSETYCSSDRGGYNIGV